MTNINTTNINTVSRTARANILAKLKAQVSGADYRKLPKESAYHYPKLNRQQAIDQFIDELSKNHAQVIKTNVNDIANVISKELKIRNISSLLYGENKGTCLISSALKDKVDLQAYDFSIDNNKEWLFTDCPAALSSSRCAIAATGTIVLWPDEDEPRSLSLVPPVHFVVVDANNIYADFNTLLSAQQWQDKLPTNVVLISGPSKTADIQQTLAYGAHGPKELIVLLLNGEF
jgi:L-lactate dehydrogenase complex protein LldG